MSASTPEDYGSYPPPHQMAERIAELEAQELGFIQSLRELEARNAELEAEEQRLDEIVCDDLVTITRLEAENAKLREHMAALRERYPNSPWIYEWAKAALEGK